jgi:hypothetical protein
MNAGFNGVGYITSMNLLNLLHPIPAFFPTVTMTPGVDYQTF